jgi:hypothetical protein
LWKRPAFYAQKRHFNWIDIGNVKDFLTVQLDILSGRVAQMYVPGVEVAERVWAGLNTRIDWDVSSRAGIRVVPVVMWKPVPRLSDRPGLAMAAISARTRWWSHECAV